MKNIAEAAIQMLKNDTGFAQALILISSGSTPRESGATMLIRQDGSIIGTVGGGVMEGHILKVARKVIADKSSVVSEYVLEQNDAASIGAICGGRATILVDYINPEDKGNLAYFEQLLNAIASTERSYIAAVISDSGKLSPRNHCLILPDGTLIGAQVFSSELRTHLKDVDSGYDTFTKLEHYSTYFFPIGTNGTIYIFGAGHCGEKLGHIVHTVGFGIIVIDDRSDFANTARFPEAEEIIVPKDMTEPFDSKNFNTDSYIVIVTRGHMQDETVLRRALQTDAGYIGMIGSKKKRETIYQHLLEDGYTPEDIARVHSPIGLSIAAETPEEIAVSITAELIKVRAEKKV